MYYLAEDPTYVLAALGLAAVACLVALQVTQQGKYLIWAGGLVALGAALFAVEQFWVTDAEQIEAVVYDLADALQASDVDRIAAHIDPKVALNLRGHTIDSLRVETILPILRRTH